MDITPQKIYSTDESHPGLSLFQPILSPPLRQRNISMHSQKVLEKLNIVDRGSYPVTERLSKNVFYLPSGSALTKEDIMYICQKFKEIQKV